MKILIIKKLEEKVDELAKLEHNFCFKKDKAVSLLNLIAFGTYDSEEFEQTGWVSLSSKIMQNCTIGRDYNKYLDLFVEHDIIEKKSYFVGKYNNRFRLKKTSFENMEVNIKVKEFLLSDWCLLKKQKARVMPSVKKKYAHLWRWYNSDSLTLDSENALKEMFNLFSSKESLRKRLINQNAICNFMSGNKWFVRNGKSDTRLHTILTNMKKIVRKHLRFEGKNLINIDINNSQIYFLLVLINKLYKKEYMEINMPLYIILGLSILPIDDKEFQRFKDLVLSGEFYYTLGAKLMQEKGENGVYKKLKYDHEKDIANYQYFTESKPLMKSTTFEVLFSKNNDNSTEKAWFKKEFPTIYKIVEKIKEKKHNTLALALQRMESEAILDIATKNIHKHDKSIPMFTIHDSIMTIPKHVKTVKTILEKSLYDFTGLTPSISVE